MLFHSNSLIKVFVCDQLIMSCNNVESSNATSVSTLDFIKVEHKMGSEIH